MYTSSEEIVHEIAAAGIRRGFLWGPRPTVGRESISIYLSIYLPTYLSIYLSIYLSLYILPPPSRSSIRPPPECEAAAVGGGNAQTRNLSMLYII